VREERKEEKSRVTGEQSRGEMEKSKGKEVERHAKEMGLKKREKSNV
jgi:hypothetical protein